MSLVIYVLVPAVLTFAGVVLCGVLLNGREQRAVRAALLLAELHRQHETIPLHEERRARELRLLHALWARS
jgi:hypothetical protein